MAWWSGPGRSCGTRISTLVPLPLSASSTVAYRLGAAEVDDQADAALEAAELRRCRGTSPCASGSWDCRRRRASPRPGSRSGGSPWGSKSRAPTTIELDRRRGAVEVGAGRLSPVRRRPSVRRPSRWSRTSAETMPAAISSTASRSAGCRSSAAAPRWSRPDRPWSGRTPVLGRGGPALRPRTTTAAGRVGGRHGAVAALGGRSAACVQQRRTPAAVGVRSVPVGRRDRRPSGSAGAAGAPGRRRRRRCRAPWSAR